MNLLQIFLIASLGTFTWMSMLWSTVGVVNILVKFTLIALAIAAGVLLGAEFGFIVKV
jgi:hypothetical protein